MVNCFSGATKPNETKPYQTKVSLSLSPAKFFKLKNFLAARPTRSQKKGQIHHNQHHATQKKKFHKKDSVVTSIDCPSATMADCACVRSCRFFAGACRSEEEEHRKQKTKRPNSSKHTRSEQHATQKFRYVAHAHTR